MAAKIPIMWSVEELRRALQLLSSAEGDRAARFNAEFRLGNAIDELIKLRVQCKTRNQIAAILENAARRYRCYEQESCRQMNQAAILEDAARHATKALEWQMRAQVVHALAEEVGITLEDEQTDEEMPDLATGGVLPTDHAQIAIAADQNCELVVKNGEAAVVLNGVTLSPISFSYTFARTAESVLEAPIKPFVGMPACIRAWLGTIDWPYTHDPKLLLKQGLRREGWSRLTGSNPWHLAWTPNEPIIVSIGNAPVDVPPYNARFVVDERGDWKRLPDSEKSDQ